MRRVPELATSVLIGGIATALWLAARSEVPAASGLVGHGLAVLGAILMLVGTFGYSRRKRVRHAGPGSLEQWLRFHILAGIVGPWLVLLHTGFAFRGLAGVTCALMGVVVASGFLARYGYAAVPKQSAAGLRRERKAILREVERLENVLEPAGAALGARPSAADVEPGWTTPPDGAATALEVERRALARLADERERAAARASTHEHARRALAWWWVLHVPLALALFALAAVHVAAALYYATLLR